jgi:hypothetical protein
MVRVSDPPMVHVSDTAPEIDDTLFDGVGIPPQRFADSLTAIRNQAANSVADSLVGPLLAGRGFIGGALTMAAALTPRPGTISPRPRSPLNHHSPPKDLVASFDSGKEYSLVDGAATTDIADRDVDTHKVDAVHTDEALVWDPFIGGYFRVTVVAMGTSSGGDGQVGMRVLFPIGHPSRGGSVQVVASEDVIAYV